MSIITVDNVSLNFGSRKILENVSFRLLKGEKIGLIGANGEGKSTFMNILTNKITPEEGSISISNKVKVGYLDQHAVLKKGTTIYDNLKKAFQELFDTEKAITSIYSHLENLTDEQMNEELEKAGKLQSIIDNSDFYLIDSKIENVSKGLGFYSLGLDKDVNELSGGQRTKVLLAKLLLEKPDILFLDEPTNFLDIDHINWLKNYLIDYENAFILISHDMDFLNSVTNIIYHLENATLTRYVGNYENFKTVYQLRQKQLENAYNRQQKEISALKDFVNRNKARVATRNMAMSRQKKLDKMDVITLSKDKPIPKFAFQLGILPQKELFELNDLVIGYDEALTKKINLLITRKEKIAFVGTNGIGKTTLLKSIIGYQKPLSGSIKVGKNQQIGYFAQEVNDYQDKTCLDYFWDQFPGFNQSEARMALARCALTKNHIESLACVLSGGEQAKLRLALIMNRETNILILDEPTNHLDIDAKEALKKALIDYEGSIILISHDESFYKEIITKEINLENYSLKLV